MVTDSRSLCKFGWYGHSSPDVEAERPYLYSDVWSLQKTTGPDRLVIAPARNQISLLSELSNAMTEPFWLLYVLSVPTAPAFAGRYQSVEELDRLSLQAFLARFKTFFESDGRHDLWVGSTETSDLLVYEKHNLLYVYGQLPQFQPITVKMGMKQADSVAIPFPHIHYYHHQLDDEQDELFRFMEWKQFPLQDSDY